MHGEKIHFEVLGRSRKALAPGDLFTFSIKTRGYFFGRVISPSMPEDHPLTSSACLIYIYAFENSEKRIDLQSIDVRSFLIPPLFTNRRPWTMGYFQVLENIPLTQRDVLEKHCFWDVPFDRYVDEMGCLVEKKIEPCGSFGLASYYGISEEIGEALGLPVIAGPEDY
ncbi:hypothetical protein HS041_28310 [Planomonospora sp. ID67723]|uniref:Imm26 family immunity protein n=1 Tax=Planomonospora sp. ID67723 TaxID=2738134 RepID=UPI0018C4047E|nr:Imm26 family immunity protein [Planomonospora sp. ID67723]MBG0831638.1 hypothetical protein [Planomonospora sp. ID67723]